MKISYMFIKANKEAFSVQVFKTSGRRLEAVEKMTEGLEKYLSAVDYLVVNNLDYFAEFEKALSSNSLGYKVLDIYGDMAAGNANLATDLDEFIEFAESKNIHYYIKHLSKTEYLWRATSASQGESSLYPHYGFQARSHGFVKRMSIKMAEQEAYPFSITADNGTLYKKSGDKKVTRLTEKLIEIRDEDTQRQERAARVGGYRPIDSQIFSQMKFENSILSLIDHSGSIRTYRNVSYSVYLKLFSSDTETDSSTKVFDQNLAKYIYSSKRFCVDLLPSLLGVEFTHFNESDDFLAIGISNECTYILDKCMKPYVVNLESEAITEKLLYNCSDLDIWGFIDYELDGPSDGKIGISSIDSSWIDQIYWANNTLNVIEKNGMHVAYQGVDRKVIIEIIGLKASIGSYIYHNIKGHYPVKLPGFKEFMDINFIEKPQAQVRFHKFQENSERLVSVSKDGKLEIYPNFTKSDYHRLKLSGDIDLALSDCSHRLRSV